jgi:hypothetical protein
MNTTQMLRTLFGVARQYGVNSEQLHDAASLQFNKSSLKLLTAAEAGALIDGMRKAAGDRPFAGPRRQAMGTHGSRGRRGDTAQLVNERELQMLADAAERVGWDAARLAGFCERQIKKSAPVTMAELNRVLWALKSMERRRSGVK